MNNMAQVTTTMGTFAKVMMSEGMNRAHGNMRDIAYPAYFNK